MLEEKHCPNCNAIVSGEICPECGEAILDNFDSDDDLDLDEEGTKYDKKALMNDGLDEESIALVDEMSYGDWDEDSSLAGAI